MILIDVDVIGVGDHGAVSIAFIVSFPPERLIKSMGKTLEAVCAIEVADLAQSITGSTEILKCA